MKIGGNIIAKDSLTVRIGLVYISLIIIQWIIHFLPYDYGTWDPLHSRFDYYSSIYVLNSSSGFLLFFGIVLLIPSLILNIVFIASTKGTTSGKTGFGLGVAAWGNLVIGHLATFFNPSHLIITPYIPIVSTTLTICLTIFGTLLFSRVYKSKPRPDEELPSSSAFPSPESSSRLSASPSDYLVGPPCPDCNKATKYMAQDDRYYCQDCDKYLES